MATANLPQDFYTWQSLATLAVASGAVVIVSNTVRTLGNLDSPWVPFTVSAALTLVGAGSAHQLGTAPDWIIAVLNSCLLFCAATGANQTLIASKPAALEQRSYGRNHVGWFTPWLG